MTKKGVITIRDLTTHVERSALSLGDAEELIGAIWLLYEDRGNLNETDIMLMSLIKIEKGLLEGLHEQVNIAIDMALAIEREQTRGDRA